MSATGAIVWPPCPWCGAPAIPGHGGEVEMVLEDGSEVMGPGPCEKENGAIEAGVPFRVHQEWWLYMAARGGAYRVVEEADPSFVIVVWEPEER